MSRVFWITGLAGAGKTSIGRLLYRRLKQHSPAIVFLDGDELRNAISNDLGYSPEDRHKCAMRYAGLCELLVKQELDVVCCTISMIESVRQWNRRNVPGYVEVYIKVPVDILQKRNQKGLYDTDLEEAHPVVGVNIRFEEPENPDIIIQNDGKYSVKECVQQIVDWVGIT